jgi:predicted HTH transcriptional regulator
MPFNVDAIPNPQNVLEAIQQGEGPQIELRTRVQSGLEIARELSAFGNSSGGWLIVGVTEPSTIVGADVGRIDGLVQIAGRRSNIATVPVVRRVMINNRPVVVIVVQPSARLVMTDAGAFVREGTASRAMTAVEIEQKIKAVATDKQVEEFVRQMATMSAASEQILREQADLRRAFDKTQTLWAQVKGWVLGGLIGALLGMPTGFAMSFYANHFELIEWLDRHKPAGVEKPVAPPAEQPEAQPMPPVDPPT